MMTEGMRAVDNRVKRLTQEIRKHDSSLFAVRKSDGMVQIHRMKKRYDAYQWEGANLFVSRPDPHFVLALTHTWNASGTPVEWGIEPVMTQLRSMDNWANDSHFSDMIKKRERDQESKERSKRNEQIDRAMDARRGFAKATNDINTAGLANLDPRRKSDGISK